jgi:hypothetical protein
MEKLKLFKCYTGFDFPNSIEREINNWVEMNDVIITKFSTAISEDTYIFYSVFYMEKITSPKKNAP